MSDYSKESEGPVIIDQRKGRFFIRESYFDEKDGTIHWIVSTTSEDDNQQQISIRVNRSNPNMGTVMKNLDGAIMDLSTLHLVKTASSPNNWEVVSASEAMDPAKRAIYRRGERLSTWTPELGDSVEKYAEYRIFEKASDIKKGLYSSPEKIEPIKTQAEEIFARKVMELIPDASDLDIALFVLEAKEPDSIHRHANLNDLVAGREIDNDGNVKKVFYNTEYPLAKQLGDGRSKASKLSAIYNYASQASLVKEIETQVQSKDDKGRSVMESCENQLKKMKSLVSAHPTRSREDYDRLTGEYAKLIGGESVRAMMSACGASAANPDYDDINLKHDTKVTGRGQEETFGNEICRQVNAEFEKNKDKKMDPLLSYLNTEGSSAYKFAKKAKERVDVAQDAAMAPGKKRIERKDYSKLKQEATGLMSKVAKNGVDLISEMEVADLI